jgi:peptidoglycan/LPS O-acetylase OafA/YrhL
MKNLLLERRGFCNLIRLLAALAVLVSHSYPVSGKGPDPSIGKIPVGELAVSVFFVLSGFFIYSSSAQHSLKNFTILRVARIFPALVFVNAVVILVIGPILSVTSGQTKYWSTEPNPFDYFVLNSILVTGLQSTIGVLLSSVPFAYVINGSLWTLPTELHSYLLCACLAVISRVVKSNIPVYICLIVFALIYILDYLNISPIQSFFTTASLKLFLIFFTGAVCSTLRISGKMRLSWWLLYICLVTLIFLLVGRELAPFLFWFLIPAIAYTPNEITRSFMILHERDYSYGLYLWAFPIAQVMVYFKFVDTALSLAILGGCLALLCAIFSWHLVELPVLKASRRYISRRPASFSAAE